MHRIHRPIRQPRRGNLIQPRATPWDYAPHIPSIRQRDGRCVFQRLKQAGTGHCSVSVERARRRSFWCISMALLPPFSCSIAWIRLGRGIAVHQVQERWTTAVQDASRISGDAVNSRNNFSSSHPLIITPRPEGSRRRLAKFQMSLAGIRIGRNRKKPLAS